MPQEASQLALTPADATLPPVDQRRRTFDKPAKTSSKVPSGRLNRFLQLSKTAGQMAAAGAAEKVKRLAKQAEDELPHVLLTAKSARLLASRLSRLRGAAMKVGQMLSLEGDNMLPKEFADALAILRSSAHTMPKDQVRQVLSKEYGADWGSRFSHFDEDPIASASIGQVHRAVTHDGDEIVLKIQYPGVAESIESDVDNLRSLLSLARLVPGGIDLDSMTEEIKKELRQEVDYARELQQLVAYRTAVSDDATFRIPAPYPEHSTSRILAMERVPGVPLLTWAETASQEDRDRTAFELLSLLFRELFEFGISQTDPNPANYFYDAVRSQIVLLDFGAARPVPPDVTQVYKNAFLGLATRDRDLLRSVVVDLGVHTEQTKEATEILLDMALESAEAFTEGLYDFGTTDLQARLSITAQRMRKFHGKLKTPPPEYIFFQRKLGGTFLICRQLKAHVNCRQALRDANIL